MSDPKEPQSLVGEIPRGTDPVVDSYRAGVAARARKQGDKHRVPIPDLGIAQEQFDPKQDGAMTLGQMAQAQQNVEESGQERGLSEDTVKGLAALNQQAAEARAALGPEPEEKPTPEGASQLTDAQIDEQLAEADDLEFQYMLEKARQDLINNDEQKALIAKRVKPMDLADGIATGEFKQHVPIKPGVLEVLYRSVSPMETEHIRRIVLEIQLRDERLANLSVDRFSLMMTVAAIVSINRKALPSHLKGQGTLDAEFLEKTFMNKFAIIGGYPSPFIHTLATHAHWFDIRVRELFTMDTLKNG